MEKIFNWDDISETQYIGEEGEYTLKVIDVCKDENGDVTQQTANGSEFHKYVCETKDKERINVTFYLTEKALWKYKNFVKAVGLKTEGNVDLNALPNAVVGRKFVGLVKRCAPKMNVETGVMEESKYFEVTKYFPVEG